MVKQDGSIEYLLRYNIIDSSEIGDKKIEPHNSEEVELLINLVSHGDAHNQNRGIRIKNEGIVAAIVDFSFSLKYSTNSIVLDEY